MTGSAAFMPRTALPNSEPPANGHSSLEETQKNFSGPPTQI